MTLREYELHMKAQNLKNLDERYRLHLQAWLNREIKATKSIGNKGKQKAVYRTFKKFFDYEKEENAIKGNVKKEKSRFEGIGKLFKGGGA